MDPAVGKVKVEGANVDLYTSITASNWTDLLSKNGNDVCADCGAESMYSAYFNQ